MFQGNTDANTVVSNRLLTTVRAQCLRIYPLLWSVDNRPSMRLEVKGCPVVQNLPSSMERQQTEYADKDQGLLSSLLGRLITKNDKGFKLLCCYV